MNRFSWLRLDSFTLAIAAVVLLATVPDARYPTTARARIVDRRGAPVSSARLQLVPLGEGLPYAEKLSNDDGTVELVKLARGPYRLHVQGRWGRNAPRDVSLRTGANELGDFVLEDPPGAGDVRLRFAPSAGEKDPSLHARIVLRQRTGELEQVVDAVWAEPADDGRIELRIADVPAGIYELALTARDGRTYAPSSSIV